MSGLFGSKQNKSTSQYKADPAVQAAFQSLIPQAQATAAKPYTPYTGQRVADLTADQLAAFQKMRDSSGIAQPYFDRASTLANEGGGSAAAGIGAYMNPYTNDVVNTTLADINHQNGIDQNNLTGNAISRGAWGGDRGYLAKAQLAADQERGTNSTIAGLRSSGWNTALGASQADLERKLQAAGVQAGLGTGAQNTSLAGAAAQLGAGDQQQAQRQAQLDVPYDEYQKAQNYPFYSQDWLAKILGQAGAGLGGTTTQTTPGPSLFSQIAGLGLSAAGLGLFGPLGGGAGAAIAGGSGGHARGGGIRAYADGGEIDDDEPVSDEYLSRLGAGSAPAEPSRGGLGATMMSADEGNLFGISDKQMALLQAGLGVLGSNSPHALQAIGEGAGQGIAAYRQLKQAQAMQQYKAMMADAAMKRAQAQADYYTKKSGMIGDKSYLVTDGPTVQLVHESGDGKTEVHDLKIPTATWRNSTMKDQEIALRRASEAETGRHNRAMEARPTGVGGAKADDPFPSIKQGQIVSQGGKRYRRQGNQMVEQ